MKISDLLRKDTIILDLKSNTKEAVIDELVDKLDSSGVLNNKSEYRKAILKRESDSSTGVGEGIAIPHAKTSAVKETALAFGRSNNGIDYDSFDGQPAHIFFMIAAQDGAYNEHLETLSKLSVLLMKPEFKDGLMKAQNISEILELVDEYENKEETNDKINNINDKEDLILAVTACPTGIAHTYMAADSLINKAKEMNVNIRVETNGSTGAKNILTQDEIKRAKGIIVAADKNVEMARFQGKKVLIVPVAQGIKNPEGLIKQVQSGDIPTYNHKGSLNNEKNITKDKKGLYKHIMNGISYMLPFVVGGGLLIAISFMFGIDAVKPDSPQYNEFAKLLMDIGGSSFSLMVPVLAGFIGYSIAERPGLAPAMVGGILANTGGAGFLGGLLAGLIAGYVTLWLQKVCDKIIPENLDGLKPVLIYPLLGIFLTGAIMILFVNKPVNWINLSVQDWLSTMGTANKILLGAILGGMMAVDMGGPINKASYAFGIAMIQAGNYYPHAAVMAGGMVPPLGIALATIMFKNKFTKSQIDSGKTNFVMGLSFITEGAIPFAAADPMIVIPACVIGSATAGALSMIFNIGLMAPHGGVFVIPFVQGNSALYLLSIIIGSIVTAIIMGFAKKDVKNNY